MEDIRITQSSSEGAWRGCSPPRCWRTTAHTVTILERDALPADPRPRPGVPRARTCMRFSRAARRSIERLLPGFEAELAAIDSPVLDVAEDIAWLTQAGWGAQFHSGCACTPAAGWTSSGRSAGECSPTAAIRGEGRCRRGRARRRTRAHPGCVSWPTASRMRGRPRRRRFGAHLAGTGLAPSHRLPGADRDHRRCQPRLRQPGPRRPQRLDPRRPGRLRAGRPAAAPTRRDRLAHRTEPLPAHPDRHPPATTHHETRPASTPSAGRCATRSSPTWLAAGRAAGPIAVFGATANRFRHYEALRDRPGGLIVTGDAASRSTPSSDKGIERGRVTPRMPSPAACEPDPRPQAVSHRFPP